MSWWLILFLCVFFGILLSGIVRFMQNERSPIITEQALLLKKRRCTETDANHMIITNYYVEFETGTDTKFLKCAVSHQIYLQLEEGVSGMLTHQGSRFKAFEWNGMRVEQERA